MTTPQKTKAKLAISLAERDYFEIDQIKEFSYTYDVMGVGDTCSFTVVSTSDGSMLRKLREGAEVKCYLRNPAVNGGDWTLKHSGLIVTRDADCMEGTIKIGVADIGWHLLHSSAPLWRRLRGMTLRDLLDPTAPAKRRFIDGTFGFQGLRTGLDANALNRAIKLGKAGLLPPGQSPVEPVPVLQIEPGESYFDVLSRFTQRFNLLVGVSVDQYLQAWNPNYNRFESYDVISAAGDKRSNAIRVRRHDDITTRYTDVICVGEIVVPPIDLRAQGQDAFAPNANKRRGWYSAAPGLLPFNHRKTQADSEMFTGHLAMRQAEWVWKRGMFDSHYLEATMPDHFQMRPYGGEWYEADQMVMVEVPELDAMGRYYAAQVTCTSSESEGDTTRMILRWPELLSASFGEWSSPPRYSGVQPKALTKGAGGGQ